MLRLQLVAIDPPAAVVGVDRVQINAMRAGNQAQSFVQIGAQLIDISGFAGIIAGRLNAAPRQSRGAFEATDVVPLPAVDRNADGAKYIQRALGIDTELRIPL